MNNKKNNYKSLRDSIHNGREYSVLMVLLSEMTEQ